MQTNDHEVDLAAILNSSHENKWVAIAPDYSRVLAAANTLSELLRLITDPKAVFHRVLPHDVSFAPATSPKVPVLFDDRDIEQSVVDLDTLCAARSAYEQELEEFRRLRG